jgi:hypothetical protein
MNAALALRPPIASAPGDCSLAGKRPHPRPSRGRSDGKRPGARNGGRRLFSAAGPTIYSRGFAANAIKIVRLCIARQNSRRLPSSAALRPLSLRSAVQVRSARRQ